LARWRSRGRRTCWLLCRGNGGLRGGASPRRLKEQGGVNARFSPYFPSRGYRRGPREPMEPRQGMAQMSSRTQFGPRLAQCCALLPLVFAAACGGGGGGPISTPPPAPAPAPAPAPTPAPAPAPTATGMPPTAPVPTAFNTAEFRRSDGPLAHNAATAWSSGHTGRGVTIAVVDTGIDEDSPEFAGRISPFSRDMTGANRPLTGTD